MDVISLIAAFLIFFLAGVGVGTFVVGASIRRIATEVKAELAGERQKALDVVTELANTAREVKKAL